MRPTSTRDPTRACQFLVGRQCEAPVDLLAHDPAVGGGVVVAAQQGALEVLVGQLQAGDLRVEHGEAPAADRLPVGDVGGTEHATDVLERQAGVLEHADEHEPAQRLGPVAALPGPPGVGIEQAAPLVEPHGRGRHAQRGAPPRRWSEGHPRHPGRPQDHLDFNRGSTVKVDRMTSSPTEDATLPPNHHAHFPGFAGVGGLVAALTFTVGRGDDADLAIDVAGVGPGDDVVDIGCGPGVAARRAAARGAASVVGVDPAAVMLRVARLRPRPPSGRPVPGRHGRGASAPRRVRHRGVVVGDGAPLGRHRPGSGGGPAGAAPGRALPGDRATVQPGASGLASHGWTPAQADLFAEQCRRAGFSGPEVEQHRLRGGRRPVLSVLARAL